jgi:ribosomal-protein-alanine N-acetyltransferase
MIRVARPADEGRLRAIQSAALDEPWPELLEGAVDGAPRLLVRDPGQGPVAYALVVPDDPVAYLAELAVAPPVQGEGHGTALLTALLDRLRAGGFETVRLTARADDERVRSFYAGFDFAVADRLPDHYDDGDAVLLVRSL